MLKANFHYNILHEARVDNTDLQIMRLLAKDSRTHHNIIASTVVVFQYEGTTSEITLLELCIVHLRGHGSRHSRLPGMQSTLEDLQQKCTRSPGNVILIDYIVNPSLSI